MSHGQHRLPSFTMPLFPSSKFSFKKSSQKRRNPTEEINVKEEKEISLSESENESNRENSEDEDESGSKEGPKSAEKRGKKNKPSLSRISLVRSKDASKTDRKFEKIKERNEEEKSKPVTSSGKASSGKAHQSHLLLCIDHSNGTTFQFDVKQASWKDISNAVGPISNGKTSQEREHYESNVLQLEEENRLLNLKIQILMEMVSVRSNLYHLKAINK